MRSGRRNLGRRLWGLGLIAVIWAVGSESREIRPSDHGLANQRSPARASPAMKSFFRGSPAALAALPEARNSSDPYWAIGGGVTPATSATLGRVKGGRGHVRVILLVASVACGAVAVALLVAALALYAHSGSTKS